MPNELKDILTNLNKDIEQEKLLEYINRKLSSEEQHAIERQLNDDPFMSDAVDGLQDLGNTQLPILVRQLNDGLRKELAKKKNRRKKRNLPQQAWVYFTVILLLVLVVTAYIIIKKLT